MERRRTTSEGRGTGSEAPGERPGAPSLRPPSAADGRALWNLAGQVGLDLNSAYAYVMWGEYFSDASIVAEHDGEVVGFVTGFRPPRDPGTLFVWQVGVSATMRGRGLAGTMIDGLVERMGASFVEATVTPSNEASAALFRSIGTRHGTPVHEETAFPAELFPEAHEAEIRFRIGPIAGPDQT